MDDPMVRLVLATVVLALILVFFFGANWWLSRQPRKLTKGEVVTEIEMFLDGSGGPYDWAEFLKSPIADPELDEVRIRCAEANWKTESGREKLRQELQALRGLKDG